LISKKKKKKNNPRFELLHIKMVDDNQLNSIHPQKSIQDIEASGYFHSETERNVLNSPRCYSKISKMF